MRHEMNTFQQIHYFYSFKSFICHMQQSANKQLPTTQTNRTQKLNEKK